jgi:hypothetical protein
MRSLCPSIAPIEGTRSEGFSKNSLRLMSFVRPSFSHNFLNRRSICSVDSPLRALTRIAMLASIFCEMTFVPSATGSPRLGNTRRRPAPAGPK